MGRRMKSIGNLVRRNYIAAKLSYSAQPVQSWLYRDPSPCEDLDASR